MIMVNGIIRVVPIEQRVIKANSNALCPKGIYVFFYQISFCTCIRRFIICVFTVEQTKAFMMFGGKHRILHACRFGFLCPFFWVELVRVKLIKIFLILFISQVFMVFYPLMPCG